MSNRISCAICGAALHSEALFDEHTDNYLCDGDCFVEWAYHTQEPLKYYARFNIAKVSVKEDEL